MPMSGPGPKDVGSRTGLWPLGSPHEIILLRCAWSHAYGRSMAYLCSLESLESIRLPYTRAPYGPLQMLYGLVNTRMQTDRNQSWLLERDL